MGLALENSQTNDALTLTLTDASTWGVDLPAYTTVTSAILTLTYKTPSNTSGSTTYTKNVTSIFTGASSTSDLVFPITSVDVGLGGGVQLPDGIWTVTYTVIANSTTYTFDSDLELLLDAIIKAEVYKKVATMSSLYFANNNYFVKPIDDILLLNSLYEAMLKSAYVAKQTEILNILDVLQRLIK